MMKIKSIPSLILMMLMIVLSACAPTADSTPQESTGLPELDNVIEVVLGGDMDEIRALVYFTQAKCTNADGLGGPPKCLANEAEGTPVEVLPFLGPEGGFIRKADIDSWNGLHASELFAVYEVSDAVYSDESYPKGEFALVFIEDGEMQSSFTLQVTDGKIVRIDHSFEFPPQIREDYVKRFLVEPAK